MEGEVSHSEDAAAYFDPPEWARKSVGGLAARVGGVGARSESVSCEMTDHERLSAEIVTKGGRGGVKREDEGEFTDSLGEGETKE